MIMQYMAASNSCRYLDVLPKIVENYNNTYHTTIKSTPAEVWAGNHFGRAKGIVEWQGIVLAPKQWGNKKICTDEEIKQCKRDYYKNNYYMNHREVCLERARKAHLSQKAAKAKLL